MDNANKIKNLKSKLKTMKTQLTIFKKFINECSRDTDSTQIEVRLERVTGHFQEFDNVFQDLELLAPEEPREGEYTTLQDEYDTAIGTARKLMNEKNAQTNLSGTPSAPSNSMISLNGDDSIAMKNLKLPVATLPTFSGKYEDWMNFRDAFTSMIDNRKDLNDLVKLQYLKSYTTDEAKLKLDIFATTASNYKPAWQLLEKAYQNERILVSKHLSKLINLPVQSKESHKGLMQLADEAQQHLKSLDILGVSVTPQIVVQILEEKLPKSVWEKWDETIKPGVFPSLDDMITFLYGTACRLSQRKNEAKRDRQQDQQRFGPSNKKRKFDGTRTQALLTTTTSEQCPVCKEKHLLFQCDKFLELTIANRLQKVKGLSLCTNCLRSHKSSECRRGSCRVCNKRHHTVLHFPTRKDRDDKTKAAVVRVHDTTGNEFRCRVLLDTCSSANFITADLIKRLGIKKNKCCIQIGALNSLNTVANYQAFVNFKSIHSQFEKTLSFLIVPNITDTIPSQPIPREMLKIPKNIQLADPEFYKPEKVDMLLGTGPTLSLFSIGQIKLSSDNHDFFLQKTRLGWILGGSFTSRNLKSSSCFLNTLQEAIEKFWIIEEVGTKKELTIEEQQCEKHFLENISQDPSGRLVVALPFKSDTSKLGGSKEMALKRLQGLLRRFKRDTSFKENYAKVMQEYIDLGHMTLLKNDDVDGEGFYIPHHAVLKYDSATTKWRIVFDFSAKTTTGISINNISMVGATMQDDLLTILIRFRIYLYVISADIEKMYRQFLVREEDRKFLKILWEVNGVIETYVLNTVPFGLASAAFLAIRCVRYLLEQLRHKYPLGASVLENDLYVDNLLTGAESVEQAQDICKQVTDLLGCGRLKMRQWAANDPRILKNIASEDVHSQFSLTDDSVLKTLGLFWNSYLDSIIYTVKKISVNSPITKRYVLSEIAKIFDPLGLLGPIILYAKRIMQRLWALEIGWDESVPQELHTTWLNFVEQLNLMDKISFPRRVMQSNNNIQLHGFCDASEDGYGACVYVRTGALPDIDCQLLCAKSRVAPLKTISIPRLELCSAALLAELILQLKETVKFPFTKIFLWSDSTITLNWINTPANTLKTFVANRVSKVQTKTNVAFWRHVRSSDNPADALSRGQLPMEFLNNTVWQRGPRWLSLDENMWPNSNFDFDPNLPERKKEKCLITIIKSDLMSRFSSYAKLKRFVAMALRFLIKNKYNPRHKKTKEFSALIFEAEELIAAEKQIIRVIQSESFSKEIASLEKGKPISRKSRIFLLKPYLDEENVLRIQGRLEHSNLPMQKKHPAILPRSHFVTELIIEEYHKRNLHAGNQMTLYALRERFWLIDGLRQVRKIIHKCTTCFRASPIMAVHTMGNLPSVRVTPARPFSQVGVDYCGPFYIKRNKYRNTARDKIYVAVFVCMVVKAVHLEVVRALTTDAFLAALRRFIARRGMPQKIFSDNATNFHGANNELKEVYSLFQSNVHREKLNHFVTSRRIIWQFIPPSAPHFGGLWESAVKRFKYHFKRVAPDLSFTYDEFTTLTIEIEAVLNSRPLTPLSTNLNDLSALTPGHILIGDSLTGLPEDDLRYTPCNRLNVWQHISKVRQDFWSRWSKEYLHELQVRSKWNSGHNDIKEGTMVLIKEDNLPPMQWKLGRVIKTYPGTDGIIRTVNLKTATGELQRPVVKLAPLPIDDISDS